MNADVKGALSQIKKSWMAFVHKGNPMTKSQVKAVLEYAVKKGYETTGQLTDSEVDNVITALNIKEENDKKVFYSQPLFNIR